MLTTTQTEAQPQAVSFKRLLIAADFSEVSQAAQVGGLPWLVVAVREVYFAHANSPEARGPNPMDSLPKEIDRRRIEAESHMKVLADRARGEGIVTLACSRPSAWSNTARSRAL
jgi:hypothetical protein